jgi:hypothetical protein
MHGKSFIFCVGKHNERGMHITGLLENLEIVELENSEGHFKEVFKEMMLQTRGKKTKFCIRRGRKTSVSFVTSVTACFTNIFTKDGVFVFSIRGRSKV